MLPNLIIFLFLIITNCTTPILRAPQSEPTFHLSLTKYDTRAPFAKEVTLRTGVMFEYDDMAFKGCVMYLQGLGDSILNHRELFKNLSLNGYRVITFDYQGQGGSSGSMNHSRIYDKIYPKLEIGEQAKFVWDQLSNIKNKNGADCSYSQKMLIGWSTGGLAAYKLAHEKWADQIVLIAPGLYPKKFVGEAANSKYKMLTFAQVITESTLTTNKFENKTNPHIDPIKPTTPSVVPLFASNLLLSSQLSHFWDIPEKTEGLVFLSGENDTYVDLKPTQKLLSEKARHFSIITYPEALHEIDNEVESTSKDLILKTLQFFNSNRKI
jgi:alpha-beta hydrolase superfamily lysophospholipase